MSFNMYCTARGSAQFFLPALSLIGYCRRSFLCRTPRINWPHQAWRAAAQPHPALADIAVASGCSDHER